MAPSKLAILFLLIFNRFVSGVEMINRNKNVFMDVEKFKEIKRSESFLQISKAYSFMGNNDNKTSYSYSGDEAMFFQEIEDAWSLAYLAESIYLEDKDDEKTSFDSLLLDVTSPFFPFLVCMSTATSESSKKSGFNRLKILAERFGAIIGNEDEQLYTDSDYETAAKKWSDFGLENLNTAGSYR